MIKSLIDIDFTVFGSLNQCGSNQKGRKNALVSRELTNDGDSRGHGFLALELAPVLLDLVPS